jgi:hypothetical protein
MAEPDKKEEDAIFREVQQSRPGENSDVVFYYSSERRKNRAALFEQNTKKSQGLAKRLFGGRGNIFLLLSILGVFFIYMIGSRSSADQAQGSFRLGKNTVVLTALEQDRFFYLFIHKRVPFRGKAYTGLVDISAAPALAIGEGEPAYVTQRIFFSNNTPEIFRFILPFESDEVVVILRTEKETVMRTVIKEQTPINP